MFELLLGISPRGVLKIDVKLNNNELTTKVRLQLV